MMTANSIYGSTRELMSASDFVEKGGELPLPSVNKRGFLNRQISSQSFDMGSKKIDQILTPEEKKFVLLVERGDCASVAKLVRALKYNYQLFDINCLDPLGRSALSIAIINENPEMMALLLSEGIQVKDSLLLAIDEEYVEGVELLLQHEERTHQPGHPYSWEAVDHVSANYTPDITPLILAAHKNNYEILKILLDRGASLPTPHDLKCSCEECMTASQEDSLRFSLSRINAYRALASPSLISLTSTDPILTAFQLSDELKRLKMMESQFCAQYNELRIQVQKFATSLLDHARTSYELEIMLNYDLSGDIWDPGETQSLERLKLALKCKQKAFVAHPNVQQLLATIWYEGMPGWRRRNIFSQAFQLLQMGLMFPIYCIAYILAPTSRRGVFMKNPFVKFVCHSASYIFFLTLLACASQRFERIIVKFLGETFEISYFIQMVQEWHSKERGSFPSPIECIIIFWVMALMWKEIKEVYAVGLFNYMSDLWNLADCFTNTCFVGWIVLRITAWLIVKREESLGIDPYRAREEWHAYDPFLISEGLFGAGMISSFLKLVHIFSINPHLGPLQISLGRMALDILKFLVLYLLVLFAFGCGMNQLLWYYADREYTKCYSLPGGLPDLKNQANACLVWRRFANLFETSQSLFWASFGLVSLSDFELTGIKEFTRFWALLMFGSYSVCNIIVLLNMLIAMMSNSFQIISEKADTEWKFARTKLWISYFDTGSTVPPPFNILPTPKAFMRLLGCSKKQGPSKEKEREVAEKRYRDVMKCIVRRYIMAEQKKAEEFSITEDDVSEIRQDINKFRYEMIDILRKNNFETPEVPVSEVFVGNKRSKQTERRILKGFNISSVDNVLKEAFANQKDAKSKDFFKVIAKAIGNKNRHHSDRGSVRSRFGGSTSSVDHIGSTRTFQERRMASFRKTLLLRGTSVDDLNAMTAEELVQYNPKLAEYTPTTRIAYAKFKTFAQMAKLREELDETSLKNVQPTTYNKERDGASTAIKKLQSMLSSSSLRTAPIEEEKKSQEVDTSSLNLKQIVEEKETISPLKKKSCSEQLIEFSPDQSTIAKCVSSPDQTPRDSPQIVAPKYETQDDLGLSGQSAHQGATLQDTKPNRNSACLSRQSTQGDQQDNEPSRNTERAARIFSNLSRQSSQAATLQDPTTGRTTEGNQSRQSPQIVSSKLNQQQETDRTPGISKCDLQGYATDRNPDGSQGDSSSLFRQSPRIEARKYDSQDYEPEKKTIKRDEDVSSTHQEDAADQQGTPTSSSGCGGEKPKKKHSKKRSRNSSVKSSESGKQGISPPLSPASSSGAPDLTTPGVNPVPLSPLPPFVLSKRNPRDLPTPEVKPKIPFADDDNDNNDNDDDDDNYIDPGPNKPNSPCPPRPAAPLVSVTQPSVDKSTMEESQSAKSGLPKSSPAGKGVSVISGKVVSGWL